MANPGPATTSTTATLGGGSPTQVGNSSTSLVSFWGGTAQAKPAAITQVGTSAPTTAAYGFTSTQATQIIASINSIITTLQSMGLTA